MNPNEPLFGNAPHESDPSQTSGLKKPPIPMKALYDRIDQVRRTRIDLSAQLRNIAPELPSNATQKSLLELADAVESNVSAAELVSRFPKFCWLITLQSSAAMTDALTAILEQAAYQHSLWVKKIRALAYPLVLLSIAIIMLIATLTLLIPPFDEMFQEFDIRLPAMTQGLVNVSRLVTTSPLVVAFVITVGMAGLAGLLWIWIGDGMIKQKLLGPSTNVTTTRQSLSTVTLQLAELIEDGLPLDHSLRIVAESHFNGTMRSILADLAVQAGCDKSRLQKSRAAMILPPNFLYALNPTSLIGPDNAQPPNTTMLRELAASYRDLSIRRKDWMSFVLAQIAVVGVGLLIATIVIALFLPLVSLVTSLSS
ncbi:MAG: hypothetical protein KDB00_30125 [Planctomycetales bacterium]|nr:hypothetical protein [Planctomycetales bacterium]